MKQVKIRILKADGVCRDTTVGKVYSGTLYNQGETYLYKYTEVTANEDTVVFTDDLGDQVGSWLLTGNVEIVKELMVQVKTRVRLLASGRRQFDLRFKLTVVRHCDELRRSKKRGITEYLTSLGITKAHLCYWRKQKREGHFSSERAVAFSRKPTMIHG